MFKYDKFKNLFLILFFIICLLITVGNCFDLGMFSKNKINFGLDFKGGSQLLLKIDFDYYLNEKLEENVDLLKDYFLENKIKALPKMEDNNIKIIYKNDDDVEKTRKYVENLEKYFNIERNNNNSILSFKQSYINDTKKQINLKTIETIKKRLNKLNIKDILIKTEENDNIIIQVDELSNLKELRNLIERSAKLTFHIVEEENSIGSNILKLSDIRNSYELPIDKKPLLSGNFLTDINVSYNQGKPIINFKLDKIGSKKFAKITRENIGKMLAMVLDNKIITVPRISNEISDGVGSIAGNFSNKEANEIVLLLKAGSLLAPLNIIEEKKIDAGVSYKLLKYNIKLFIYGLCFLILFLFILYKANALFAIISIFINIIILFTIMSVFGIKLTLIGIIAILSTILVSISTNIFIFEKYKQEIKIRVENIYNFANVMNNTFNSISPIILNSNTLIILIVTIFYIFGENDIKNFSIILIIGIISSLLSNLVYLRGILNLYSKNKILLTK